MFRLTSAVILLLSTVAQAADESDRHVIVITLDGFPAYYLDDSEVSIPVIRGFARRRCVDGRGDARVEPVGDVAEPHDADDRGASRDARRLVQRRPQAAFAEPADDGHARPNPVRAGPHPASVRRPEESGHDHRGDQLAVHVGLGEHRRQPARRPPRVRPHDAPAHGRDREGRSDREIRDRRRPRGTTRSGPRPPAG